MRRIAILGTALLMTSAPAFAGPEEDKAEILELWNTYESHVVAGDAASWLGLWDGGGIQMPPGAPMRSKAVMDSEVPQQWSPEMASAMNIDAREVEIMGDWAYSMGVYTLDVKDADGNPMQIDGKFMTILKRQEDGHWAIYRDIFNSNK